MSVVKSKEWGEAARFLHSSLSGVTDGITFI